MFRPTTKRNNINIEAATMKVCKAIETALENGS